MFQVGLLITFVGGIWLDWYQLALLLLALIPPAQLLFWALPESPSWLAAKGRQAAMEAALKQLGRAEEATSPFFVQLVETAAATPKKSSLSRDDFACCSWLPSCRQRSTWQPVLISLALMFFSQATGVNTVLGYAKLIFIEAHLDFIHEDEAMGITAALLLVSCGLAIGLSKVAPRRVLLLASAVSCCLTLTLLGLYFYLKQVNGHVVSSFAWLPLAALLVLIVCHMCGYGAVAWTVIVEILPCPVRSQVFPVVVAFNCICNFGFALSFTRIENLAGYHVVFWLHAGLTALGAVVIFICVPETRDRTELEIAMFFMSSKERDSYGCSNSMDSINGSASSDATSTATTRNSICSKMTYDTISCSSCGEDQLCGGSSSSTIANPSTEDTSSNTISDSSSVNNTIYDNSSSNSTRYYSDNNAEKVVRRSHLNSQANMNENIRTNNNDSGNNIVIDVIETNSNCNATTIQENSIDNNSIDNNSAGQ